MTKCNYCGNILKDNRFDYCNINHRKAMKLSLEGERNMLIKEQDLNYNKENYKATSKRLKRLHKKIGHLVNSG